MIEIKQKKVKLWSKIGSRATFGMAILELAKTKGEFFAISADLCASSGLERFRDAFPERFINIGIAEQNMIGVAAGLAKDGTPVFTTSFAPFISMRASEQIRMFMGYMSLNIKAISLGSGFAMWHFGNSHFGIEDVSVMRSIPNITVISPADCTEIVKTVEAAEAYTGPVYIRLTGGPNNPIVYDNDYTFEIGKANTLAWGKDVALIASGTMVYTSLQVAQKLSEIGISCTVIDMHTIKPLDTEAVDSVLNHKLIVTVEEHNIIGGLGSAVAEYLSPKRCRPPQLLIGINDFFPHAGDYEYLLGQCGLTVPQISEKVLNYLQEA